MAAKRRARKNKPRMVPDGADEAKERFEEIAERLVEESTLKSQAQREALASIWAGCVLGAWNIGQRDKRGAATPDELRAASSLAQNARKCVLDMGCTHSEEDEGGW